MKTDNAITNSKIIKLKIAFNFGMVSIVALSLSLSLSFPPSLSFSLSFSLPLSLSSDNGAKLDEQGWEDWTPLHFAAEYGCLNFFFLMLQKGASPNARDSLGLTPVDHLLKNDCSCVKPPVE